MDIDIKNKTRKKGKTPKINDRKEELEKKIEDLEDQFRQCRDQLKRAVADYQNLEKRNILEKNEFVKYANKELLERLVPAFDTLFLAGKYTTDESVKLTIKTILEALKDVGVEIVDTNGEFDPNLMEAVSIEEGEDGKVLEELRSGFTLYGKLIRPAQVKVGKANNA